MSLFPFFFFYFISGKLGVAAVYFVPRFLDLMFMVCKYCDVQGGLEPGFQILELENLQ